MKVFFVAGLLLLGALSATAQTNATTTANSSTVSYNLGDLEKLDKLQLSEIYIAKLNRLYSILPYIAFEKLQPQSPNDLKIPTNQLNEKALTSMTTAVDNLSKTNQASLSNLGPYADKKNLISSILFIQSVINKIELVGLGMDKFGFD
ncbi:MAG: hypothetical protein KF690_06685 [Bacteroidetes bacterium]|nr:hypothetical protein [Bacteroidota bacterium]